MADTSQIQSFFANPTAGEDEKCPRAINDNQDNEDENLDRLTKLHNIVSECDSSCISIVGDFNANVKTNANFAVLMKEFCEQFNYVWTSCNMLPNDTYTYVSAAWDSCSWLDHCILDREPRTVIHVKRAKMFDPMG